MGIDYDTSKIVRLDQSENRRIAVLMEGANSTATQGKTGISVIRYQTDKVCCIIDSETVGKTVKECIGIDADIPIVPDMTEALAFEPTEILIGVAPPGGRLPAKYRAILAAALGNGVNVVSGLHQFLTEDDQFTQIARSNNTKITDLRYVPQDLDCSVNIAHTLPNRRVLTVGSDCALGKMTVSIELDKAMQARGKSSVFIPTGQTGVVIAGWGFCVDRVIIDFATGAMEMMVMDQQDKDWQMIEGQGALDHAAYGTTALALLQGSQPTDLILVHHLTRDVHNGGFRVPQPINPLETVIQIHEMIAKLYVPSCRIRAIAANGLGLSGDEIDRRCGELEEKYGLPCADVFRHGTDKFVQALLDADV